jgi:DNA excision repair protein ERCC-1
VNKTDVETLRASYGVRFSPTILLSSLYILCTGAQSFARIAQADAAQLAQLPGFGPKKVSRLKDAFERPFRTGTTSALAGTAPATSAPTIAPPAPTDPPPPPGPTDPDHPDATTKPDPTSAEQPAPRSIWDIDLDLNSPSPSPPPPPSSEQPLAAGPSKRTREESPPWDIEQDAVLALDDEDSDSDVGADASAGSGLGLDEDVDMDVAPALRAKRRRA